MPKPCRKPVPSPAAAGARSPPSPADRRPTKVPNRTVPRPPKPQPEAEARPARQAADRAETAAAAQARRQAASRRRRRDAAVTAATREAPEHSFRPDGHHASSCHGRFATAKRRCQGAISRSPRSASPTRERGQDVALSLGRRSMASGRPVPAVLELSRAGDAPEIHSADPGHYGMDGGLTAIRCSSIRRRDPATAEPRRECAARGARVQPVEDSRAIRALLRAMEGSRPPLRSRRDGRLTVRRFCTDRDARPADDRRIIPCHCADRASVGARALPGRAGPGALPARARTGALSRHAARRPVQARDDRRHDVRRRRAMAPLSSVITNNFKRSVFLSPSIHQPFRSRSRSPSRRRSRVETVAAQFVVTGRTRATGDGQAADGVPAVGHRRAARRSPASNTRPTPATRDGSRISSPTPSSRASRAKRASSTRAWSSSTRPVGRKPPQAPRHHGSGRRQREVSHARRRSRRDAAVLADIAGRSPTWRSASGDPKVYLLNIETGQREVGRQLSRDDVRAALFAGRAHSRRCRCRRGYVRTSTRMDLQLALDDAA